MNTHEITRTAMNLTGEERAELANRLLTSLDPTSEDEIAESWLDEAQRRAQDIDDGIVEPVPAEEVRRKALSLLRRNTRSTPPRKASTWKPRPLTLDGAADRSW
jgi:putative addiction module component (TIGR02574 family)